MGIPCSTYTQKHLLRITAILDISGDIFKRTMLFLGVQLIRYPVQMLCIKIAVP